MDGLFIWTGIDYPKNIGYTYSAQDRERSSPSLRLHIRSPSVGRKEFLLMQTLLTSVSLG